MWVFNDEQNGFPVDISRSWAVSKVKAWLSLAWLDQEASETGEQGTPSAIVIAAKNNHLPVREIGSLFSLLFGQAEGADYALSHSVLWPPSKRRMDQHFLSSMPDADDSNSLGHRG
jgi:hypothetical protein